MKTQEEIWREHTASLDVQRIIDLYHIPSLFQIELSSILNELISKHGFKSCIELGCETGVTSMFLNDGLDKTFLDLNSHALELAEAANSALGKNGNYVVADRFDTQLPEKAYDLVFNAGVVEHFNYSEREAFLKEYKRIMADNGTMVIAYPNHYSFPYRSAYLVRNYIFMGYKWPYPKEVKLYDMKRELDSNGLEIVDRMVISKESVFNWWNFFKPFKALLKWLDKISPFEGYLTVLLVRKRT